MDPVPHLDSKACVEGDFNHLPVRELPPRR
jgi:hypothetical protein